MLEKVQIVILVRDESKINVLLLKTNEKRGGFWQNITGAVEQNDFSTWSAARREVLEETGIELAEENLINLEESFEYFDHNRNTSYIEKIYLGVIEELPTINLSPEHQSYELKPSNEIKEDIYKFKSNYKAFLESMTYLRERG